MGQVIHKTLPLAKDFSGSVEVFLNRVASSLETIGLRKSERKALIQALSAVNWPAFMANKETEKYFSRRIGDVLFHGYVDCLDQKMIWEWKTTRRNDVPRQAHVEQAEIYAEILGYPEARLVYFNWRTGQATAYRVVPEQSHIEEIQLVGSQIADALKKGTFARGLSCASCKAIKYCATMDF